jgi:signal transduction histidine kinase
VQEFPTQRRGVEPGAGPSLVGGARDRSADSLLRDVQSVLAGAVQQLRRTTGCSRAVAWIEGPEGAPRVSAADYVGDAPSAPTSSEFAALAGLDHACELRAIGADPVLTGLAERHACDAATPLLAREGGALAVLLIGVDESGVRPRTLGDLDAVAAQVTAPFTAALAMERLCRVDAEVQHLDRLATLGRLAAEIAHEVRNPLVSIKTFLQLLPERRDDPDFFTRFFDIVSDEMRRMERLLDLMIDHARPSAERGEPGPASLREVLASVADLISHRAASRGVRLEIAVDPGLPDAALGEDGLRQLLLNLALNAASATREGGTVQLRARAHNAGIELSIEDEGPGVPEALREAIFEPFFTTRSDRPGGLGLSICRRIVESAGGSIVVEGAADEGACFRVWLPARS